MLETVHQKRLSFDDALYLSANFTYVVTNFLLRQAEEGELVVATDPDGIFHFLGPGGSFKFPARVLNSLVPLFEELGKAPSGITYRHPDLRATIRREFEEKV